MKAKARRALGAAKGVVNVVRACGSRIAFRCRNRAAYPRRCSAPPAIFVMTTQPLSAMSIGQLNALRANLEAEEEGLMEKLRELWEYLEVGSHLQPAFVDPDRLAHVTRLLLAGDTGAVERDPDNDEVSGAATIQLTSQRLEAALLEVHAQMQAVCEERRRRKGMHAATRAAGGGCDDCPRALSARAASSLSPCRGAASRGTGANADAGELGTRVKITVDSASSAEGTARANKTAVAHDSRLRGRGLNETPKRKLSTLSLSESFVEDPPKGPELVGSPRPKLLGRWRVRLARRSNASQQVPISRPANEGGEAHGLCLLQLGYTMLPTHD
ncbi:hypothetical protein VOLCADRAFT_92988 [Volvox carteri f. nagariensis]|uniref:Uncharacterized protein n=1 Tax=Volvox carteri f. nagariensis TaxID=3068 RepID=D8U113_VOLCA|nr:uncharacterized protein VOLCADRAFT_92988 [Volvox carteri f. nagariensis]EFJ46478.1 hypothetical protein VOLCADRAFT_92988 [Volvox carteri f. nagariensis]|eukprot:XP_002952335.1 hypothetical protein VOLCADRAFT_92988 [Volvox carteri f. nagariensis]